MIQTIRVASLVRDPACDLTAEVAVSIGNARLATAVAREISEALAATPLTAPSVPMIRWSKEAVVPGMLVVVKATARNARQLPRRVAAVRAAGALGVQIVWDGEDRTAVEPAVFKVLEDARGGAGPPVMLARDERPSFALLAQIHERSGGRCPSGKAKRFTVTTKASGGKQDAVEIDCVNSSTK